MRIAAVQLLANNPHVLFGSTRVVEDFIEIPSDEANLIEGGHLAVRARAQKGPVRIELWRGPHPDMGTVVFDGSVLLPDGLLFVQDVEGLNVFSRVCGVPGLEHLKVRVDDLGEASTVDLILGGQGERMEISRVRDFPLPALSGVAGPLAAADLVSLILQSRASPKACLVNAVDLVIDKWVSDESPRAAIVRSARVRQIVEWLRWHYPMASRGEFSRIGEALDREIAKVTESPTEEAPAVSISEMVMRGLPS